MPGDAPPAAAWDWLARQRLVWQETRRRLVAAREGRPTPDPDGGPPVPRPAGDVPDWARDHPDLVLGGRGGDPAGAAGTPPAPRRDYRPLDTRAQVIAALRTDYLDDPAVRAVVDTVVGEVVFLGRLDVPLHALGVREAPRGMRWWWTRLTGSPPDVSPSGWEAASEPAGAVPLQLRLVDVLAGYGDA